MQKTDSINNLEQFKKTLLSIEKTFDYWYSPEENWEFIEEDNKFRAVLNPDKNLIVDYFPNENKWHYTQLNVRIKADLVGKGSTLEEACTIPLSIVNEEFI